MTSVRPLPKKALTPNAFQERFKVRKASDMSWGVCLALYGTAGSGKSTLAASAADTPHGSPLLFLDAEGGSRAVAHRDDIEVIDVSSWKEIDAFTTIAKRTPDLPWKTIVFDNMSEYLSLLTVQITGDADAPSQPEWGKITLEFLSFIRTWRDISKRGTNVILIAWEDEVKDEIGRTKHNLAFTPKIRQSFPGMIDIIGFVSVVDKSATQERILDFSSSSRTESKFRRSQEEAALEIPYRIQYGLKNMPMPDILSVLRGGEHWPTKKYASTATSTSTK